MKISHLYFLTAIFLFYSNIFSQSFDTVFVQLDSLKENSIELDTVWRYHSGDNSSWASQNYNSSNWDTLKTSFFIDEIPDSILWTGIGWFRKTIVIDSLLRNKSIALEVFHYGASQIYWNGNLIHEFGQIGTDTSSEKINQPNGSPIVINLDTNIVNTLAIRYSNQKSITDKEWMKRWFRNIGFQSAISDINKSFFELIYRGKITSAFSFGISGMFFSLAVLYFFLLIFYARRIENLYYALFTFFTGLVFIASFFEHTLFINQGVTIVADVINGLSFVYIFLFYLAFLNSIFYKKMTKIFWIVFVLSLVYSILFFYFNQNEIFSYFVPTFIAFTTLEGLRIIIVAIRKGTRNAWVIGGGVISFATLVIVLFGIAILGSGNTQISGILGLLILIVGLFSIPLSMSVYLAKEIALTNKNLEKQLITVKELSEKELEHVKRNSELELNAERTRIENERKFKELEEARNLQLSLLPKSVPELLEYEIAAYMDTATEVGGDYYDFHFQDDVLTVAIGDATGHGLKAGTMVTATKSLFNNFAANPDILNSMKKMSVSLKKMNFRFLSMCFALLKFQNNIVKITSAGMPPVFIYRKESGEVEEILLKGMPLGSVINYPYQLIETELKSGDMLFLYSDGFPELFNYNKELLGYKKIKKEFAKVATEIPTNVINNFQRIIDSWKGEQEINDDITFVVIKKK